MLHDTKRQDHLYKNLYAQDEAPPHPGEVLRDDLLPALGLSKAALARALGLSRGRLDKLLGERAPVSLDVAFRLGIVLGHGARYWLGLQMQHDSWRAAQGAPATLRLKPLVAAKSSGSARSKAQGAARARAGFR